MISLRNLLTEGKKLIIPVGGEKITFTTMVGRDDKVIFIAGSGAELEKLEDMTSYLPAKGVQNAIQSYIENKLKVPFSPELDYPGAGYAFKVDVNGLISKLK